MKQIYVVEGKNDVNKLKSVFPLINVLSVNGSEIDLEVIKYLKSLKDTHEIIIITDPDFPGLKIRKRLEEELGQVSHIFLDRSKSFSKNKKKIGLEHLSTLEIKNIINQVYKPSLNNNSIYTLDLLYELKLIGDNNSKNLREYVASNLNLGYVNGKRLLDRLNNSGIEITVLKDVISNYNKSH